MIIHDTETGTLAHGGNELTNDAKNDDPSAIRGGRPAPGIALKLSGDFWFPDPQDPAKKIRFERVFVGLGTDDSGAWGGQFEVQGMLPGQHSDKATLKLLTVNTKQILCHVPLVALAGIFTTEREWPWETQDPTHGIAAGDFADLTRRYGFPSEEVAPYLDGRLPWAEVIAKQDRRDDFRHFPRQGPPPPPIAIPAPVPPPINEDERAQRVLDVDAARAEFPDQPLDEDGVQSYLSGRKGLREFHNDEERRAGFCRPQFHRPGRPY